MLKCKYNAQNISSMLSTLTAVLTPVAIPTNSDYSAVNSCNNNNNKKNNASDLGITTCRCLRRRPNYIKIIEFVLIVYHY